MENFKLAQIEFEKLNFHRALEYYAKSLDLASLSSDEKLYCCQKILLISKKLNLKISDKLLQKLGKIYLQEKQLRKAAKIFMSLSAENQSSENFELTCSTLLSLGELKKVKKFVVQYLDFLSKRKLSTKGLKVLKALPPGILNKHYYFAKRVDFAFLQYNLNELSDICLKLDVENQKVRLKYLKILFKVLSEFESHWIGHIPLTESLLKLLLKDLTLEHFVLKKERKVLVKLAISCFVNKQLRPKGLELIKLYAKSFKKKKLEYLADYFVGNVDNLKGVSDFEKSKYLNVHDLNEEDVIGEADLLARDIKFLLNTKQSHKAYELVLKLKEIDSEHPILRTLFNNTLDCRKYDEKNALDHDSSTFISSRAKKALILKRNNESIMRKIILTMPTETLRKYYSDFIFTLNSLDFPNTSVEILNFLEKENDSGKEYLARQYLLIETLVLAERKHEALDVIDNAIQKNYISENENLEFLYLKGEILTDIGLQEDALRVFRFIYRLNPEFRFVKEKLEKGLQEKNVA